MDTTNSSENQQRRVEDRKPVEVIDWAAPGAPAVPLSPAATSGTDDFMVYGRAGNRRADLEAKLRDALTASIPGADAISGDAPGDDQWMFDLAAEYESRGNGLYGPITFTAQQLPNFVKAVIARIESAAAPAPNWFNYDESHDTLTIHGIKYSGELMRDFGRHMPQCQLFELVERQGDGALCVKRIEPATASGDELRASIIAYCNDLSDTACVLSDDGSVNLAAEIRSAVSGIRAAVSAATKPTADLSGLTRYGFHGVHVRIEPQHEGMFVKLADVQSILATKPAAAPTAWLATDLDGRGDVAFTQEEAKRRAGEGCIHFYPLFDVEVSSATPAASTTGAAQTAEQVRERQREECWSRDEEDFNHLSLSDLIDSHEDLKPGDTVWVGEAVHPEAAQMVNVDSILENIGEAAYDIGGEHAEDYPDVTAEQTKELEQLVVDWLNRSCNTSFWTVTNIKPYVLSADDFPTPTHSSEAGDA